MQEQPFIELNTSGASTSENNDIQMEAYGILMDSTLIITDTNSDKETILKDVSKIYTTGAGPCHIICAVAQSKDEKVFAKALFHKPDGTDVQNIGEMINKILHIDSSKEVVVVHLHLFAGSLFSHDARKEINTYIDEIKEEIIAKINLTFIDHKTTEINNLIFSPASGINKNLLQKLLAIEKHKLSKLKGENINLANEIDIFENELNKLKLYYLDQNNDYDAKFIK